MGWGYMGMSEEAIAALQAPPLPEQVQQQRTMSRNGPINLAINTGTAIKLERERALADPFGARDWDTAADARQAAWDNGPFRKAIDTLFRTKTTVGLGDASH